MYYCQHCQTLHPEGVCPICGGKKSEVPQPGDLCFLAEKEMVWSEMLADVLKQKEIPFISKPVLGAGVALNIGRALERYQFFVPYSHYLAAKVIVSHLFSDEPST